MVPDTQTVWLCQRCFENKSAPLGCLHTLSIQAVVPVCLRRGHVSIRCLGMKICSWQIHFVLNVMYKAEIYFYSNIKHFRVFFICLKFDCFYIKAVAALCLCCVYQNHEADSGDNRTKTGLPKRRPTCPYLSSLTCRKTQGDACRDVSCCLNVDFWVLSLRVQLYFSSLNVLNTFLSVHLACDQHVIVSPLFTLHGMPRVSTLLWEGWMKRDKGN